MNTADTRWGRKRRAQALPQFGCACDHRGIKGRTIEHETLHLLAERKWLAEGTAVRLPG
jgi:hypothetical protein